MIKKIILLFVLIFNISFAQSDTLLIFSEVMFSPTSGNNEFIEIYNLSETQSVDLSLYKIKYYTSTADQIVDAGFGTTLLPNSYAIIFENDYDIQSGIYNSIVPANALVLKIADNSFGSSGMANTTSRPLWLLNSINDTVDYCFYSANNSTAFSDEKKILNRDSLQTNWANSLIMNGTPGFTNSVTPINYDLNLYSLAVSPVNPISGNDVTITVRVRNNGVLSANTYSIEIFNDTNLDSIPELNERIFNQDFTNLSPGDSISASTILNSLSANTYQIIARVNFVEDQNTANNIDLKQFIVLPPGNNFNDVVINEIMYAPSSGEPEWIELYNKTNEAISIKYWKLSDATTTIILVPPQLFDDIIIPAESYFIISKESNIINFYNISSGIFVTNIPALNNTGDAVVIKDINNVLIDSVSYLPAWGGNIGGRSLERLSVEGSSHDPANWESSLSINKATPGEINSITPKQNDLSITLFKSNNEFGIIGNEISFSLKVKNIGLNNSGTYTTNLFRDANKDSIAQQSELLLTQNGLPINSSDSALFNFATSDYLEGANFFIAKVILAPDDDSTNNYAFTKVTGVNINEVRNDLVVNEIMYAPNSPQPEWIELYNRSDKTINLKNYQIADASDTVLVINTTEFINPDEFFVISRDSSILNYYNLGSDFIVSPFPTLNNTSDKIIILDSLNRTIDSLQYFSGWGGNNGKSLERINPDLSSIDSSNWKTSASIFGATPGTYNSVTQKDYDIKVTDIIFNPRYPLNGDNVSIIASVNNAGKNSASFSLSLYEDTDLDSIPDLFLETISNITLSISDSGTYQFNFVLNNLQLKKAFFVKAAYNLDQDTTNNYKYKSIEPGFPNQTVVINEIMFAPLGGEPEWIELFNNSEVDINLKDWSVWDVITTPAKSSIKNDIIIPAKGYFILAKDSSILNYHRFISSEFLEISLPSFNNDRDGVVLKDNRGITIDSVFYLNQWGGTNGFSIERISTTTLSNNQFNWASSYDIEQSTPGRINSVTPKEFDLSVNDISFNPRFPTQGENVSITAKIKNNGNQSAQNFTVEFYVDTDSNNVADLILSSVTQQSLSSGDSVSITSTASIMNIQKQVLTAVRISYLEDEDTLNNYYERTIQPGYSQEIVKINEIMFNPADGNPEWVELINTSRDSINIKSWIISDVLNTPTKGFITNEDIFISPDEIFIIAKDTSFNSAHPGISCKIFYTNFGSLGNTADGVVLYDFRNGIIDSLFYRSSWGGIKGYSLERISLTSPTNDSTNWSSSLDLTGSTPGNQNSFHNIPVFKRDDVIINEIMFDPGNINSEYIEFYNISNDSINIGGWNVEDENGNSYKLSQTSFIVPPKEYFILIADSSSIEYYNLSSYNYKNVIDESSLGLVNTGELILLKDVRGNVIDSVVYDSKWHNKNIASTKNKSLERINPSLNGNDMLNWSSCVAPLGGTPGMQNSIFAENLNQSASISLNPNPFSPDNDGFEDFTVINYNLSQATSQVRIKIFDSKGRLVRTLLNNQASGQSGSVIFDGLDDDNNPLRIGIYIVFLEAINDNSGVVETLKTVVVVARKL